METISSLLFALLGTGITLFPVMILVIWSRKKKARHRNPGDVPKMEFFDDWVGGPAPTRNFEEGRPFPEETEDTRKSE